VTFDYYAALADENHVFDEEGRVRNLASGFVDRAVDGADSDNESARQYYRKKTAELHFQLPPLNLDDNKTPSMPGWFSLAVTFELQTPWYSKDDRPFHVLDNPVRKDRVFGMPFISAASWKGLLRWSCRMESGLLSHLGQHGNKLNGWRDPDWVLHLFGNERIEDADFSRGALAFRPTWFDKVGFEVINPHDRSTRAGTKPIVYEVVPGRTNGVFHLLYAPPPNSDAPADTFRNLFAATEKLLTVYGFSAKRTAGWGMATIKAWRVAGGGGQNDAAPSEALAHLDRVRLKETR
jgi:CRISPR-associated protein Cmr2